MKKLSIYILALTSVFYTSCSTDDKIVIDVIDGITSGGILRTRDIISGSYNAFDNTSIFSVMIEEQDRENGALLSSVDVMISFTDTQDDGMDNNVAEMMFSNIPASAFTTGERGLPETTFTVSLAEALSAVGLGAGQFNGGDSFTFRFILNLTDGTTWTDVNGNGNITGGSFFSSPYRYVANINCIPLTPFPGDYMLSLEDTFGDGWDGAFITVNVDGVSTDYTIEDGSTAEFTITVPDGTTTLVFTYTAGNFENEHIWELLGPNGEIAASGSPGPPGEIVLNICS